MAPTKNTLARRAAVHTEEVSLRMTRFPAPSRTENKTAPNKED
jgi:hypothetical protein